ncbi:MAG: AAA family ATPase [Armatimonadetes bacterium]|nr:AAA family ATPase [Armatimonadota bacterium]
MRRIHNSTQALEAEKAVVSAMLHEPDTAIPKATAILRPDDFTHTYPKVLFTVMAALHEAGQMVDEQITWAEIDRRRLGEAVGGFPGVMAALDFVPTAENVGFHARIVADRAACRTLHELGQSIPDQIAGGASAATVLAEAQRRLGDVGARLRSGTLPQTFTAAQLAGMVFPEPVCIVHNLLYEGLNLLVGSPKVGKSWLALAIGIAVASGGRVLGSIDVAQGGEVLCLALEDSLHRVRNRLQQIDDAALGLETLHIRTEWSRLDAGGLVELGGWLSEHPAARMVVIDTWARVRPKVNGRANVYQEDTEHMAPLQTLALSHHVALVVLHHRRKATSGDFLDEVSGSTGLTGVADAVLVLKKRSRMERDATLHVTGRDIDDQELALRFDQGIWTYLGDAREYTQSEERQEILNLLQGATSPMSQSRIAEALGTPRGTIGRLCSCLVQNGLLRSSSSGYYRNPSEYPEYPEYPE